MTAFDPQHFLGVCPRQPGIYRMLDDAGKVLYVGKARNLQARLSSYFQKNVASIKTRALVARITNVETTVTASDTEALLLEQSLIKAHRPPYNILLRDDKSYPYIRISISDTYPRVSFHRGTRRTGSAYYGPYPSGGAVREAIALVEKVFQLRNCSDSYFRNRSRPCLQHQIHRCTAPCVAAVTPEAYAQQVALARDFLSGRSRQVADKLAKDMDAAAAALDFEQAAIIRDQLAAVQAVQEKQFAESGSGNLDAVSVDVRHGLAVVAVLIIRNGRVLGHRTYRPDARGETDPAAILSAFVAQYYLGDTDHGERPDEILLSHDIEDREAISEALQQQWQRKVRLAWRVREQRAAWLSMAATNAAQSLAHDLAARTHLETRFQALHALLPREPAIQRIECFDISHTQGEAAVASCVVFDSQGARKSDYRHFNVTPDAAGDDYQALEEAVRRRYQRVLKEQAVLPELLLIDGGKGQMQRCQQVIEALQLDGQMMVVGIGKGPSRKPGVEVLYLADGQELVPGPEHRGLHLLQQVRDEAHRFALTGHRARRSKPRKQSRLDEIPGVGPKRRKALLTHFGGLKQLKDASLSELSRVPGINTHTAETIYEWFHQ